MSDWFAVESGVRQGCRIAPDLFLGPMDHVMERTVHRGIWTLRMMFFLLAEMLEVLVLALEVIRHTLCQF